MNYKDYKSYFPSWVTGTFTLPETMPSQREWELPEVPPFGTSAKVMGTSINMPKKNTKNIKKEDAEMEKMDKQMMESMLKMQNEMVKVISRANADEIFANMMPRIEERIQEKFGFIPQVHEIKTPEKTTVMEEILHEKFDEVLQIVNLNIPVYLTGKAGTGKNVICKQVAKALDLDFYFTNAVTQEYKLTGFIDANGNYQETQFYKAFTQGGLFFLDEMDASIPEVLVILNAAIANRYFDFPTGKVEAHPNFRVIAAGNTTGLGADNNYTGRYCLDRASLDRFAMVNIDYSKSIEDSMAHGKKDLVSFAHAFRAATEKTGVECLFSYRTIERIALLEDVIPNLYEILSISLLKGLNSEDVNTIRDVLRESQSMNKNRYVTTFIKGFDF